jgi:tRNA G18 (ribose-2'-O)-methylase SpoU
MRSHNNIGSIFRTADAFLIEAIYLCGITACPPHRDIHKTALGATETVEWKYFEKTETAIEELKSAGYIIYAVEQVENATNLDKLNINKETKIALVVGHEINGVSQQIVNQSDLCIEIPQLGTKHSLNVAVSVGIVVWHLLFLLK